MIIEVSSATIDPAKEKGQAHSEDLWKRYIDAVNRELPDANALVARPDSGLLNKIMMTIRFASYQARDDFYANPSEELAALRKEHVEKKYTIMGTMERYYYKVVE